jgi:hypothetical protein
MAQLVMRDRGDNQFASFRDSLEPLLINADDKVNRDFVKDRS